MDQIVVYSHALKHGLTEKQIEHAWRNAIAVARIDRDDDNTDYVAIGFDQNGRPLEMTGRQREFGILIYHANTPPTHRAFRELGLTEG